MINKAQLLGKVVHKEFKSIKNDKKMLQIALMTTRKWKDSKGIKKEKTTFHNVHFFDKPAEIANKYIQQNEYVFVSGEIQNDKIKDGNVGRFHYALLASEFKTIQMREDYE